MSRARQVGIGLLLGVGFLQSAGYILGVPALRGIGMALVASPLPLVFSHFRGLETFSSTFFVKMTSEAGEVMEMPLDPKVYAKLEGPYNRRNVYGAIASFGPKLTQANEPKLVQSVLKYGFCQGPLLRTLGMTQTLKKAQIRVTNPYGKERLDSTLEVECN